MGNHAALLVILDHRSCYLPIVYIFHPRLHHRLQILPSFLPHFRMNEQLINFKIVNKFVNEKLCYLNWHVRASNSAPILLIKKNLLQLLHRFALHPQSLLHHILRINDNIILYDIIQKLNILFVLRFIRHVLTDKLINDVVFPECQPLSIQFLLEQTLPQINVIDYLIKLMINHCWRWIHQIYFVYDWNYLFWEQSWHGG